MEYPDPDFTVLEPAVLDFWKKNGLHAAANKKASGEPFYFLDGPPYTSGKVHIGTAWNKSMKDLVVRLRRMQGRRVWDRAGYDMHGLPNEHAAMRELGLKNKEDIVSYGVERFATYCRDLTVSRMHAMNEDFARLGVWLDFDDPYQTISDEWIGAVWWLIKHAHENGRLYEGLRPMYWDPVHETALAKHELYYQEVEDKSIYVKFPRLDAKDEFFIVWTTTPWTIPFNLMIMVNPDVSYAHVKVDDEVWIIAEQRVDAVLAGAGKKGTIIGKTPGKELVGAEYTHFFADTFDYASLKKDHPNVHTVVASVEYVTTDSGTGLVHAAPGCGPEDYEVGVREDVPAWNLLDERGRYPEDVDIFSGKRARFEDAFFTEQIEAKGMLVAIEPYVHDYPFAERSKQPIVYKTTRQWFLHVDDLKERMVAQNKKAHWVPEAGFNAFNSWLENLRDNSLTKQRFWGTPFPVWRNEEDPDDVIVVGSKEELERLCGHPVKELHKPWIDDVIIKKGKKTFRRLPDVIDVWVDAGVASFASLHFPARKDLFDTFFPADFIIEGNDQIRGWFNLLMVASTVAFDKLPFKNVYMHGMIQDAQGRKMSKSEGNYILPEEVIGKYGADAVRLYLISGTRAGQDLNYNLDDCENKRKSLLVYWNIHKYLLDLYADARGKPSLGVEERYILSRAHSTAKQVADLLDAYRLDRIPEAIESLLDDISRTYIQLVRPKVAQGTDDERAAVRSALTESYLIAVRLLASVSPFITEAIWRNLRGPLGLQEQSVHLSGLPAADEKRIDTALEGGMHEAMDVLSVILAARDKAQTGLRWPLRTARVSGVAVLPDELASLVAQQANVKEIRFEESLPLSFTVDPDFKALGKSFGARTAELATAIKKDADRLGAQFAKDGKVTVLEETLGPEFLSVTAHAPDGWAFAESQGIKVLVSTAQDEELLKEGFFRELVRRIQRLRKEAGMDKTDRVSIQLATDLQDVVSGREDELKTVCGVTAVSFVDKLTTPHTAEERVRKRALRYGIALQE